ncbi:hypothetical protein BK749_08760 [Bacillus thuringiensis serovar vazensis]|uniref:Uncharacterized protein n=1 Tax=Bacillus thuringiensis serovar vazensis TaxID=180867 RepID=A0A243CYK5_BACTU|nr:hypothetical protein B7P25_12780 [Bacillus thuringiensis]AUD25926.1 hypothetical protein CU648_27225 [Bacillus sp. HBCD-sjtu]MBR9737052.1 hypothetical protein [Bacillus paranthracis]OTX46520.1 hypothetical protein BK723_28790 [Bacillus thuringiensis serovar pondicheriensis]OTY77818.1 hypothetical protein BK749_08760 [Bacillus thuringiensis serovar vazensis]OUB94238.1 hypothetical protein BK752_22030 [Bacillus thuringiensis serovar canadensis]OXM01276.1 hypothetical protein B6N65_06185 [Bac
MTSPSIQKLLTISLHAQATLFMTKDVDKLLNLATLHIH